MVLTLLFVLLWGPLIWIILNRHIIRKNIRLRQHNMILMKEAIDRVEEHRIVFQKMIYEVHHKGIVPISSTALGLNYVISLVIVNSMKTLLELQEKQDWRTYTVTKDLSGLIKDELFLFELEVNKLKNEIQRVVNEYDKHQQKGDEPQN